MNEKDNHLKVGQKAQRRYISSPMENVTPLQILEVGILSGQQCAMQMSTCHARVPDRNSPIDTKNKCQVDKVLNEDVDLLGRFDFSKVESVKGICKRVLNSLLYKLKLLGQINLDTISLRDRRLKI